MDPNDESVSLLALSEPLNGSAGSQKASEIPQRLIERARGRQALAWKWYLPMIYNLSDFDLEVTPSGHCTLFPLALSFALHESLSLVVLTFRFSNYTL